jgi:hypothetical protein
MHYIALALFVSTSLIAVTFERNEGQAPKEIAYFAATLRGTAFLTPTGFGLEARAGSELHTVRFEFADRTSAFRWQGENKADGCTEYRVGNDPSKWVRCAQKFASVRANGVLPGIDLRFHTSNGELEYDLEIAPHVRRTSMDFKVQSVFPVGLNATGDLEIQTPGGPVRQRAPISFQIIEGNTVPVQSRFQDLGNHRFRITWSGHNPNYKLTVDPTLEFATYIGGEGDDEVRQIVSNLYVGHTTSVAFLGAPTSRRRSRDIFIRFNIPSLPTSMVIGGSGDDVIGGVANTGDPQGFSIVGTTSSTDLPTSGFGARYNGGATDGFVYNYRNLGSAGVQQNFFYVGGSGEDGLNAVTSSSSGSAGTFQLEAVGFTASTDLRTIRPSQETNAGGRDVLYIRFFNANLDPVAISYTGGSGDDEATGIIASGGVYVGNTTSPDFPGLGPSLGGQDGFAVTYGTTANALGGEVREAIRIGGADEDRLTSIAGSNVLINGGRIATFAGSTRSIDLPVQNSYQSNYGGGLDAMFGQLHTNPLRLTRLSYFGGPADEEFSTVGSTPSFTSEISMVFGGWSTGPGTPVKDPLQGEFGGGESDGIYADFRPDGELRQAGYYGGSGTDRIHSVTDSPVLRLAGASTSTNLPVRDPLQVGSAGRMDGFVAIISSLRFHGPSVIRIGKDLAASHTLTSAAGSSAVLASVRTLDASKARLWNGLASVDSQELWIAPTGPTNLTIEGYANEGITEIEISAPGYETLHIPVELYPGIVVPQLFPFNTFASGMINLTTWSQPLRLGISYQLQTPPEIPPTFLSLRSNLIEDVVYTSSNPAVARIDLNFNSGFRNLSLVPVSVGTATLSVSSSLLPVQPRTEFTVNIAKPLINTTNWIMARNMVRPIALPIRNSAPNDSLGLRGSYTLRSADPSRLLVSLSATQAPSAIVQGTFPLVRYNGEVNAGFVHALADNGEAALLLESEEFESPIIINVRLTPVTAYFAGTSPPTPDAMVETTATANNQEFSFPMLLATSTPYSPDPSQFFATNNRTPSALPINILLGSSNSGVATPRSAPIPFNEGARVIPLRPGSADFTARLSDATITVRNSLRVNVRAIAEATPGVPRFSPSQPLAGVDAITTASVTLPANGAPATTEVIIDVADPNVVQIAPLNSTAFSSEIRTTLASQSFSFRLLGKSPSGTTQLRVRSAAFGQVTVDVPILPTAIVFASPNSEIVLPRNTISPGIGAGLYLLDETTRVPLQSVGMLPGTSIPLRISSQGPSVEAVSDTATLTPENNPVRFSLRIVDFGTTTLVLDAPVAAVPPSFGRNVRIQISPSEFIFAPLRVYKDAASGVSISMGGSNTNPNITVESLTPDLLLVAQDASSPAVSSITRSYSNLQSMVLVGLQSGNGARIRVSGTGITTREIEIPVAPLTFEINSPFGNNDSRSVAAVGSSLLIPVNLPGGVRSLRLGGPSYRFRIDSENTSHTRAHATGGHIQRHIGQSHRFERQLPRPGHNALPRSIAGWNVARTLL